MRPWRVFRQPEYFFRPRQILPRVKRLLGYEPALAELAWGLPIHVVDDGHISNDILNHGVFDRVVSEALVRLLEEGELAMDVGGNVGQYASIMALRSGPSGRVVVFEPHPEMWPILRENLERWQAYRLAPITAVRMGLSRRAGTSLLYECDEFHRNQGSASMEAPARVARAHEITTTTLDEYLGPDAVIGVVKLDVEGHESAVLEGASRLLRRRAMRDVVFEELRDCSSGAPTPDSIEILEAAGYVVFSLDAPWRGPRIVPWRQFWKEGVRTGEVFSHNYLATLDARRAHERLRRWGWRCLRQRAQLR